MLRQLGPTMPHEDIEELQLITISQHTRLLTEHHHHKLDSCIRFEDQVDI